MVAKYDTLNNVGITSKTEKLTKYFIGNFRAPDPTVNIWARLES